MREAARNAGDVAPPAYGAADVEFGERRDVDRVLERLEGGHDEAPPAFEEVVKGKGDGVVGSGVAAA
ncbi:hypothetical protein HDU97_007894 [Phlyctochytrium planicorne]|nr:hypothetical protein HDU97_007894 [Phlyctochytrium planicorne]